MQFADQANRVGAWHKEKSDHLIEVSIAARGTLEVNILFLPSGQAEKRSLESNIVVILITTFYIVLSCLY